jgi:hypothetical protein
MGRIRTIKPEFPHSESLSRVCRDARLCFVEIWTICDDAGRARGNARMLAGLLFPYDRDAPDLIEGWLADLERVGVIIRYEVAGNAYVAVTNWLAHQRIEKPKPSKIPPPPDASPTPREPSVTRPGHVGDASRQEGKGMEGNGEEGNGREGTIARSAGADEPTLALQAYNRIAERLDWPQAQLLTGARKARLAQRLAECGGLAGWHAAMARARASPFLRGDGGRDRNHEKWRPDLDFFLQQSSFTRLMEGKYDDRAGNQPPTGFDALLAGARAAAAGPAALADDG